MHESELTKEEKNAIASLRRLAKRWPKSLHLMTIDNDMTVCKRGVPSDVLCEHVELNITSTTHVRDMHDDMNNGLDL